MVYVPLPIFLKITFISFTKVTSPARWWGCFFSYLMTHIQPHKFRLVVFGQIGSNGLLSYKNLKILCTGAKHIKVSHIFIRKPSCVLRSVSSCRQNASLKLLENNENCFLLSLALLGRPWHNDRGKIVSGYFEIGTSRDLSVLKFFVYFLPPSSLPVPISYFLNHFKCLQILSLYRICLLIISVLCITPVIFSP
jgi:hypothetical protein